MRIALHEDYNFINTAQTASTRPQHRLDCIRNSCCDYYYCSKLVTRMVPRPYAYLLLVTQLTHHFFAYSLLGTLLILTLGHCQGFLLRGRLL